MAIQSDISMLLDTPWAAMHMGTPMRTLPGMGVTRANFGPFDLQQILGLSVSIPITSTASYTGVMITAGEVCSAGAVAGIVA